MSRWRHAPAVLTVGLALLVLVVTKTSWLERWTSLGLELGIDASGPNACRVIHMYEPRPDHREGDDSHNSQVVALRPGERHPVVQLPPARIRYLSLQPLMHPGEVVVRSLTLLDPAGRTLRSIPPGALQQIRGGLTLLRARPDGLAITWNGEGSVPEFIADIPYPLEFCAFRGRVTPLASHALFFFALGLAAAGGIVLFRPVRRGDAGRLSRTSQEALPGWLPIAGAVLLVLGTKMFVIDRIGFQMPHLDQWDGEVWTAYLPFMNGTLTWKTLLAAHNEHRIFWHRIWSLWLLQWNGGWNPLVQTVANALLHTAVAVGLGVSAWRLAGRAFAGSIAAVLVISFVFPVGWENTRFPFQSQFYFAALFAVAAFALLAARAVFSAGFWFAVLWAWLGLFTVAGGALIGPAIGALGVAQAIRARRWTRAETGLVGVGTALFLYSLLLMERPDYHAAKQAQHLFDFLRSWGHALAWPHMNEPWAIPLVWGPFAWLAVRFLAGGLRAHAPLCRFLLLLGGWVLLVSLATAYGRGAGGKPPASRHTDLLSLGLVANGLATVLILRETERGRWNTALRVAAAAWWPWVLSGVALLSMTAASLPHDRTRAADAPAYTRFLEQRGYSGADLLPSYPNPPSIAAAIRNARFQAILPPGVRRPAGGADPPDLPVRPGNRLEPPAVALLKSGGTIFLVGFLLTGAIFAWTSLRSRPGRYLGR
jgi:hypothetical protein